MIFRLEYKNKALKTARVDIITPTGTGVETVEGTGYPFMLKYEGDKKNKGLMFLSSSAEINIYETPLFNIDTLKTSGEKDIRVNYYIDSVLEWTGFVIPDFFSREIGGDGVVSMVASDRLSVLDSEVLEGLPVTVTLRTLLSSCLAKTGLDLPLKTVVDFAISGTAQRVLDYKIRSQRLTDTKGRSVNCKDIIKSILVATNSKLMQRKGAWWVVNKMQHELGGGRVYTSPTAFTSYVEDLISFTDVTRGAMRTIAPVAGGVGVFQEYGGGKLIPDNYNFKNGLTGWTNYNGFVSSTNNRRVLGYTQSGSIFTPIYDDAGTSEPYLVNRNISPIWVLFPPSRFGNIPVPWDPYAIKSTRIVSPVVSSDSNAAKAAIEINAVGLNGTYLPFSVVLKRPGRENLFLNRDNEWQPRAIAQLLSFKNDNGSNLAAVSAGMSVSAVISADSSGESLDDVGTYTIEVLIFGSGLQGDNTVADTTTLINSASVQFSAASNDTPKGTLYKADQGGESYTKIHDTETTVFGDYLTGGLNGYFYNYAPDDTSSLLAPNGSRSQPAWVNTFTQNTEPLPLLQQTIRQMRRMFSVAHDFIKGEIDVADFDPLSVFEDCERRFVIVEAEFDFLRGSLQVVLEEVAYQNLTVREYIYSYFGEGDEGIRGISGISAGSSGGGGGGGMAPEPSWLENEITIDSESGLLSVDGWHVKGNLIIEGQVNQWLAQQLVVDDARIQVNRRQGGATVDSGLVIHDRDTGLEVSSLVYDVNGIWRAGGQRIYTDAYKPLADNATNLGGHSAASYPRKAEAAVITGAWTINNDLRLGAGTTRNLYTGSMRIRDTGTGAWIISPESGAPARWYFRPDGDAAITNTFFISQGGVGFGTENPQERIHAVGNGLFTGNLTAQGNLSAVNAALSGSLDVTGAGTFGGNLSAVNAALSGTLGVTGASTFGGNVGTSNFASQLQGWRVTPAGVADFRHIYTDELQAKAFTADISQALVGSDVLTKSVAKLAQNWATTANGATSTIYVEELEGFPGFQVFAVGDRLLLRLFDRSGGGLLIKNIWATVASYVSTTNNVQRYTITVNSGGAAGHTVYAGSMILDYGTSGSGVIERTVLDAMGSPYSQVKTWVNDPSNPANYTIHNRTGNLDGIANASGFGFYGENTFLTGKLLVGDLTKAGQFMEYENGQLNIKGQITVTGGNAATKADVDAVQVGGRNLAKGTAEPFTITGLNSANHAPVLYATAPISAGVMATLSFDWKVEGPQPSGTFRVIQSAGSFVSIIENIEVSEATSSGRYVATVTMPATSTNGLRIRMDYLVGDLSISNFKLELGNRATDWTPAPEDVDAGIAAAESAAKTFATSEATAAESAAKDYTDDLTSRVENTLGLADLEGINETLITDGKVRTALLEVTDIVAQGITAETVEGLTLNFDKGTVGGWAIDNNAITSPNGRLHLRSGLNRVVLTRNVTPYLDGPRVQMYYNTDTDWGLWGSRDGSIPVFQLGSTNQIAGINFDDSRLFTQNWELNKDGSFYFGAGGTIDGGLIAGSIESANWDGTNGSRLNLVDGSLEFGNTIKVDSFAKEIIVKDGATQNTGVRIGDFLLSPTSGGAGALDVDLSGSSLVYSVGDFTLPNSLTYINGSGVIRSVSENVSTSLTAGNNYVFQTSINARINRYNVVYTETDPVGAPITTKNSITTKIAIITVSLFSGGTKVGEQNFGIFPVPDIVGNTFYNLSLNISIPFVAASSSLRVEIAQSGEVTWKVRHPANEGGLVEYRKVTLVYEELNAASRVRIIPSAAINELSAKGFLSLWGPEKYFRIYDRVGVTNFIEARGVQQFISPNGTYRLRVSDSGIEKSTNGGQDWTTL